FYSVSIDVQELFYKLRYPAIYEKVENNIKEFLNMNNNKIKTQVSLVKTRYHNEEDLDLFKKIWEDKVNIVRIYEEHSSDGKFGSLKIKRNNRQTCVMPFYEMLVYYNGTLGRCNHDWDSNDIGDLNYNSISEIWNNNFYKDLRVQHKSLKITDEVCKNCDCWYPEIAKQGTGEVIKNEKN
nr:SPASM domain-containing protein [Candidatus Dependentiae bacterium]